MTATVWADAETGEIAATGEIADVKTEAAESVCRLLDQVWSEVSDSYPVTSLTALGIAHKITAAVVTGALAEHKDILAEPLRPKQQRMEGL